MEITNENQSAGGAGESSVNSDDMWSTGSLQRNYCRLAADRSDWKKMGTLGCSWSARRMTREVAIRVNCFNEDAGVVSLVPVFVCLKERTLASV